MSATQTGSRFSSEARRLSQCATLDVYVTIAFLRATASEQ